MDKCLISCRRNILNCEFGILTILMSLRLPTTLCRHFEKVLFSFCQMAAIVRDYGLVVITRHGSDPEKFIYESDLLTSYKVR